MSAISASPLRTLAFGDLDGTAWGIAWIPDSDKGFAAVGDGARAVTVEATLTSDGESGEWRLHGYGIELTASPAVEAPRDIDGDFDALCRVHGGITVDGVERDLECLGRMAVRSGGGDLDQFDSIRDVCAWFDPSHGLSLLALRPRKSRGQESDVVSAVALEPEGSLVIADPRLSTTYSADGRPLRVGLELWLEDDEQEEPQYPRRASGQVEGAPAHGRFDGFEVRAQFVRWESRYGPGGGVYLLAQHA